jgi:3',5'-cyclic AMP phosphodiesterase CpdA
MVDRSAMIRVTQFSDCHFTTSAVPPYGGLGYNTTQAWDAIFDHAFEGTNPDRVIVTGDIADRGRAEEYELARALLGRIPVPVNVAIGNHDQNDTFNVHLSISLSERVGDWLFIFADSNFDGRKATPTVRCATEAIASWPAANLAKRN